MGEDRPLVDLKYNCKAINEEEPHSDNFRTITVDFRVCADAS